MCSSAYVFVSVSVVVVVVVVDCVVVRECAVVEVCWNAMSDLIAIAAHTTLNNNNSSNSNSNSNTNGNVSAGMICVQCVLLLLWRCAFLLLSKVAYV